jgi:hypothetical protein
MNIRFMSLPRMTCAAYAPPDTSDSQAANGRANTIVPDLPVHVTDLMSSKPARLATLYCGFTNTLHVAFQSSQVTGLPSLHTADGLYVNVTVCGRLETSFGALSKSRGLRRALSS